MNARILRALSVNKQLFKSKAAQKNKTLFLWCSATAEVPELCAERTVMLLTFSASMGVKMCVTSNFR
ncbi:hypothetical protein M975_2421 [Buttiauxella brennerae ATCC 51605]|uniref:Uncharacterized protein n=1 Tax=Buttiauxella brennerae ATCC 51605 TaxID=1354251 RepID=A0A1B7IN51_9ENTR|nr:hypothetical protein M975_2421 [Buttiauxella brennerae ATCC 51605]